MHRNSRLILSGKIGCKKEFLAQCRTVSLGVVMVTFILEEQMKVTYSAVFLAIAMIGCASSPQIPEVTITIDEYGEHLMHYFENKNDAIIYETISIYKNDDNTAMLDRIDSIVVFFFYGIQGDDIARYNNFKRIVAGSKVERLINIFNIIDETDIAAYLEAQDPSPDKNHIYWTLYLATGNTRYMDYLIKIIVDYYHETENANYYLAARSALWSLASNMLTFISVREYVQNNATLPGNIRDYITHNDPNKIQADTGRFINEQRQRGAW